MLSRLFKKRVKQDQSILDQNHLVRQEQKSLEDLRHIFDNLKVGIWIKDYRSWKINYISKGAEDILQIPLGQILNPKMWEKMIHPEDLPGVLDKRKSLKNGETVIHKYRVVCGDGTTKWLYDQTVPWFDVENNLTQLFGIFADITNEMEMQEQLEHMATYDPITALPNQQSLYKKIDKLISNNQEDEFALLYLDLDRFTLINDSMGHHIGDLVLKEVANRLLSVSSRDVHITCLNNNDFIIIVENFPSKDIIADFASALIEIIGEVITVDEYELFVTTSIGISHFPSDGDDKVQLIASAHTALNRAKRLGINNIEFHSFSKDIASYKKMALEQDMRKAIKNNEFELYFQPIVKPDTGHIKGAEALIRWNHREWGLVSPDEFIPLAEENHLIIQMTDWAIKEVCTKLRTWKDQGYTLSPISVNISPIRFMKSGLVEVVKKQLDIQGINPDLLSFEITESSLLRKNIEVLKTIRELNSLGIQIALDDFGTGYASLQYLREFPIDVIKIDQVFMQNIHSENIHDAAIISSIIHLARKLDLTVIAEGVEEYDQLRFLEQNECDLVQGYLFSKPVPTDIFSQMLKTGYLRPSNRSLPMMPEKERRKYFRLQFPTYAIGEMSIIEVNKSKVKLGKANILIENISLGGLKILSSLNLPVNSSIKFKFFMELVGQSFEFAGELIWKEEARRNTFYYGIQFLMNEAEQDQLANIINKLTVLLNTQQEIQNTPFLYENPYTFLMQNDK